MKKLNTKTITLTGSEQEIRISGQNCDIRNDGVDTVYAAGEPNITAGADGVMSIPAGHAVKLLDVGGAVYLLGTGSVQICGNDYAQPVFKCAPSAGGNPNLLINSWFGKGVINQRGQTTYTAAGYTIDRWISNGLLAVNVTDDGITLHSDGTASENGIWRQTFENGERFAGKIVTMSCNVLDLVKPINSNHAVMQIYDGVTWHNCYLKVGLNYKTIKIDENATGLHAMIHLEPGSEKTLSLEWLQIELGSVATPFIPPDPTTELAKCQRYYQIHTTDTIDPVDLRPSMRTITDIRQRGDGNYEYIAEL